jgi:hypothetical protein
VNIGNLEKRFSKPEIIMGIHKGVKERAVVSEMFQGELNIPPLSRGPAVKTHKKLIEAGTRIIPKPENIVEEATEEGEGGEPLWIGEEELIEQGTHETIGEHNRHISTHRSPKTLSIDAVPKRKQAIA